MRPREVGDLAFQRAYPAFLRHDDRSPARARSSPRRDRRRRLRARLSNVVRRLPSLVSGPYFFFTSRICQAIIFHCLLLAGEQRLDRRLLLGQLVLLLAQRHFLEAAQAAQPRVEDVVRPAARSGSKRAFSASFGSSSSRMMRITSSRLRKTMIMPASTSSRLSICRQAGGASAAPKRRGGGRAIA